MSGPLVSREMRGNEVLQSAASGGPPLSMGWRGDAVRILQRALRRFGYRMPNSFPGGQPDGDYQREMADAVTAFQRRYRTDLEGRRVDIDGRAGRQVLTRLDRMLAGPSAGRRLPPLPRNMRAQPVASDQPHLVPQRPAPRDTRVRSDAGDRRMQQQHARRDSVLPPEAQPLPLNPIVAEVHAAAADLLVDLIRTTQRTLNAVGCGRNRSRRRFDTEIHRVFAGIAVSEQQSGRLDALVPTRDAANKRRNLIKQVVRSLGGTRVQADQVAERETTSYQGRRTPGMGLSGAPTNREVIDGLFRSGCALHDRLGELRREVEQRYRGSASNPRPGIEQTFGLLARFPDVARDIYAGADLPNLSGVPPQIEGETNRRAEALVHAGEQWDARRRQQQSMKAAGFVILGLVVGVVSFGTMSALGATLATAGFSVAAGAANIVSRSEDYEQTRDAYAMGAASSETLQLSESRLRGAYRSLVIDVLTMGAMSRVGGAANVSRFAQLARVQAVGAAGSALSMAADPDVMRAPNTVGLILFGVAVSTLADVGSDTMAARFAARGVAVSQVQVSVPREAGSLQVGTQVGLCAGSDQLATRGTVRTVSDNTLTVAFDDGSIARVRMQSVSRVETSATSAPVDPVPPARIPPSAAAASVPRAERSASGGYIYYRAMGLAEARILQAGRPVRTNPGAPNPGGGKVVATRLESAEEFLKVLQHREGDYEYVIAVIETRTELALSARHLGPGYGPKYHGTSFMPGDAILPDQVVRWREVSMRGGVMRYTDSQ